MACSGTPLPLLEESTDIPSLGQLRYVHYCSENRVHEDLLFCQPLEGRCTGEDIFIKLSEFFIANELSWNNCVGVCTDDAAAMTSKKQEVPERTNLPTFLTLFKNFICIKTRVCPNITLVGNSVPILKHSHVQNNVSNKRIVGSS
jgi:hypothetical protein